MANNYTTIAQDRASSKFILARIEPARYINDDLSFVSGTTYTATLSYDDVSKLKVNGVEYTRVTSSPAQGEYIYNVDTKLLTINATAAITALTPAIVFYYLFFSSLDSVFAKEEPYAGTGTLRLWQNRIKNDPSLGVDLSNVQQGYIRTSNISLNLENVDSFIDQYLGDNDSFSKKEIKVWHCLNSVENIARFYTGTINSLTIGDTVLISTDNSFQELEKPAFFRGISDNSYYDQNLDTPYVYVIPEAFGKPIQQIYGEISTFDEVDPTETGINFLSDAADPFSFTDNSLLRNTYEAVNVDYTEKTVSKTTTNYVWALYKTDTTTTFPNPQQDHTETLGTVSTVIAGQVYDCTVADSGKYLVNDEVFIDPNYDINHIGIVIAINSATSIRVRIDSISGTAPTTSGTIVRKEISQLFLSDPAITAAMGGKVEIYHRLSYGTHYTVTYSLVGDYVMVTLDSNFATFFNYPVYSLDVSPDSKLYYRRWSTDSFNHGDVIQRLVENTGLTVNSASITAANATTINVNFGIPLIGESEIKSTRYYLEKILECTNGYLVINEANEVEYHLIDSPSSTNEITEDKILDGSFSKKITYSDIVNQITIVNKHGYTTKYRDTDTKNTGTYKDVKSQNLHGVIRSEIIEHVLEDGDYIKDNYMSIRSNRKQLSTYKTKLGFTDLVGDDIKYSFKNETNSETIIKTSKNSKEQTITTTDFLGV